MRPRLTPRQGREIAGVFLILAGFLGILAMASSDGSILTGLRHWLLETFDRTLFVPVGGALAFGAYLLWPRAPRPRPVDVISGASLQSTGLTETMQAIQALAPSFNFPRPTVSDGTDAGLERGCCSPPVC